MRLCVFMYTHKQKHTHTHAITQTHSQLDIIASFDFCSSSLVSPDQLCYLLTYCMEQSPSWEANRFAASQEIPLI
jgi:hypothetical protein